MPPRVWLAHCSYRGGFHDVNSVLKTQPQVGFPFVLLHRLDTRTGSQGELDAQASSPDPFQMSGREENADGNNNGSRTRRLELYISNGIIYIHKQTNIHIYIYVCLFFLRKPKEKRSPLGFQNHFPSFRNQPCLTLSINRNRRALKFREHCSFNFPETIAWRPHQGRQCSGLGGIWVRSEGFCFCEGVAAGREAVGVIYLFDFVNRSCKAIWNIHAELSEKPVSVLFTAQ